MAVLFGLGSLCFMVGGIVTQWSSTSRPAVGVTFFVGSICFTSAAYLQYAQAVVERRAADRLSALVQLVGTLLFNISTFAALRHNLTTHEINARVWAPDAFGSIAFLVSSGLAFVGFCHHWWCFRWRIRAWQIVALNLLGSIAFGISAIASLVEPSTGEPVGAHIANSGTSFGGACFLIASVLLIPEAAAIRSSRSDDAHPAGDAELAHGESDQTEAGKARPVR
jgi:uncharacterized membrane protein